MAQYQTITSDKDRDTALKYCKWGGIFGIHQFYVGNILAGIIYMFTFGLLFVGWLVDLYRISMGTFTDNVGMPLRATKAERNSGNSEYSSAEEILKLKNLLDEGIITQKEFEKKKKELL